MDYGVSRVIQRVTERPNEARLLGKNRWVEILFYWKTLPSSLFLRSPRCRQVATAHRYP